MQLVSAGLYTSQNKNEFLDKRRSVELSNLEATNPAAFTIVPEFPVASDVD
jgi:hypothetical protein